MFIKPKCFSSELCGEVQGSRITLYNIRLCYCCKNDKMLFVTYSRITTKHGEATFPTSAPSRTLCTHTAMTTPAPNSLWLAVPCVPVYTETTPASGASLHHPFNSLIHACRPSSILSSLSSISYGTQEQRCHFFLCFVIYLLYSVIHLFLEWTKKARNNKGYQYHDLLSWKSSFCPGWMKEIFFSRRPQLENCKIV